MEFAEHIRTANVENVVLTQQLGAPLKGTLCVTGHHLLLFGRDGDSAAQLLLLLRNIDAVEKSVENLMEFSGLRLSAWSQSDRAIESSGTITIKCKDLRILQLDIPGMEECLNVASSIEALSSLDTVADLYPFYYRPSHLSLKGPWGLSLPVQDFAELSAQTGRWRLSEVNRDYSVCLSYPPAVIVPHTVDDNTLRKVARFRQGGRFPVLCYYHRPNNTVIMRSSQPLQGANRKRCREDESLLHAVIDGLPQGYIIDTRSAQLAQQARVIGGGFESKANYSNWKRLHRNLERGKPLLEAFVKLVEACSDQWQSVERWLSRLESSRWLSHVQNTLSAVGLLAECVESPHASGHPKRDTGDNEANTIRRAGPDAVANEADAMRKAGYDAGRKAGPDAGDDEADAVRKAGPHAGDDEADAVRKAGPNAGDDEADAVRKAGPDAGDDEADAVRKAGPHAGDDEADAVRKAGPDAGDDEADAVRKAGPDAGDDEADAVRKAGPDAGDDEADAVRKAGPDAGDDEADAVRKAGPDAGDDEADAVRKAGPHAGDDEADAVRKAGPDAGDDEADAVRKAGPDAGDDEADAVRKAGPHAGDDEADAVRKAGPDAGDDEADAVRKAGPHAGDDEADAVRKAGPDAGDDEADAVRKAGPDAGDEADAVRKAGPHAGDDEADAVRKAGPDAGDDEADAVRKAGPDAGDDEADAVRKAGPDAGEDEADTVRKAGPDAGDNEAVESRRGLSGAGARLRGHRHHSASHHPGPAHSRPSLPHPTWLLGPAGEGVGAGWTPFPATLHPFGLLACPAQAGGSRVPAAPRLRVAASAPVPAGHGLRRAAAASPGPGSLRFQFRHLPLQQRRREVLSGSKGEDTLPVPVPAEA
ncbi:uncharacterized protein LOC125727794 isoform X2 [Brienomyrus brachyistius]|uniref:uncharacterized protein LOC125727794 isoform X2 n=1 Tax=Brienomyrus brachyistius TaxID=42636 RepID=UPI0020B31302|nr:uncharacterized protein LOC125727794 isoform X2 [Brienomyrus brachyistius]